MDVAAGVIGCGVLHSHGEPSSEAFRCRQPMVHSCVSMMQLPKFCRDKACPYAAPHPELNCVFECASADVCAEVNTDFAYPNNVTRVCERCSVVGCRQCDARDRCIECFENFKLDWGGYVCTYVWDDHAKSSLSFVVPLAAALLILLFVVLTVVDYCACCGRCLPQEAPPEGEAGMEARDEAIVSGEFNMSGMAANLEDPLTDAIDQGKRHRMCCKIKDMDLKREGGAISRWRKIPFFIDLTSRFLAGVGLPLFHQWYYFLFLYSLMMCIGTAWVYERSDFNAVLQKTGLAHATHTLLGDSGMSVCGLQSESQQVWQAVRAFAFRAAIGYFVLWLLGLCLSIAHAVRQRGIARQFYSDHPSLSEFALNVEGFPPEATDEEKIRSFLRESFGHDSLEVSVCFDFRHRKDRVNELLEKVIVCEDVDAGTYNAVLGAGLAGRRGLGLADNEKAEVRQWLEPGTAAALRNAGSVFAIFPRTYDLLQVRETFEGSGPHSSAAGGRQGCRGRGRGSADASRRRPVAMLPHSNTPEWLPGCEGPLRWVGADGRMHQLRIRDVVCEPPEVVWEHLGRGSGMLVFRGIVAYFLIAVSFAVLASLVFVPLAKYTLNYMNQAGSTPTGLMMTLLGFLQMTATWLILLFHIRVTSWVGFSRRDREALMVFRSWTIQCLLSFLFSVAISIFPPTHSSDDPHNPSSDDPLTLLGQHLTMDALKAIQDVTFQVRASVHLFHVLVPGGLFLGYLMFILQGFVWPFVSTLTALRFYHGRRLGPELTARMAERQLEPLGMSLGHDYMGQVCQPISCSFMLFFATGVCWQTFAFLALWSLFMMIFMRYVHLRSTRRCYFTTNRLDTEVLFGWGFPLSMVLGASCFWAARLRGWPMQTVPLAFFSAYALYFLLLLWVNPLSFCKEASTAYNRKTYDEIRLLRFYDWQNCNPIKVLLSHCSTGEDPIIPFEVGKEYLQANDPRWQERVKRASSSTLAVRQCAEMAPSTSLGWRLLAAGVPEVETLIDHVGAIGNHLRLKRLTASATASASASVSGSPSDSPRLRSVSKEQKPASSGTPGEPLAASSSSGEESRQLYGGQPRIGSIKEGTPAEEASQVTLLRMVSEEHMECLSDIVRDAAAALSASAEDSEQWPVVQKAKREQDVVMLAFNNELSTCGRTDAGHPSEDASMPHTLSSSACGPCIVSLGEEPAPGAAALPAAVDDRPHSSENVRAPAGGMARMEHISEAIKSSQNEQVRCFDPLADGVTLGLGLSATNDARVASHKAMAEHEGPSHGAPGGADLVGNLAFTASLIDGKVRAAGRSTAPSLMGEAVELGLSKNRGAGALMSKAPLAEKDIVTSEQHAFGTGGVGPSFGYL